MKASLRKRILEIRKNLSETEVREKSDQIKKQLYAITPFAEAQTILFYVSYDNEVSTHEIIKGCLSQGKKVVVPISQIQTQSLLLSELHHWEDLEPGSYNILEPKKHAVKEVDIERVDLIFVPGVAFDKTGRRIGHGKGYYDRLLRESSHALSIGLAFEFQIVDRVPTEEHDISVNIIVTEQRTIVGQPLK
jgi:5-formyltetrahydrofolate cyclo-ligase